MRTAGALLMNPRRYFDLIETDVGKWQVVVVVVLDYRGMTDLSVSAS